MIVFSKASGHKGTVLVYNDIVKEISPVWGVLFAILCTACFLTRTILIKLYYFKFSFNPMNLTVLSYIVQGVVVLFIVLGQEFAPFDVMRDNILAGGFGFLGNVLVNHATTKGYAGPAAALTNIQVVLQVVIDAVFLYQIPNWMQVLA